LTKFKKGCEREPREIHVISSQGGKPSVANGEGGGREPERLRLGEGGEARFEGRKKVRGVGWEGGKEVSGTDTCLFRKRGGRTGAGGVAAGDEGKGLGDRQYRNEEKGGEATWEKQGGEKNSV